MAKRRTGLTGLEYRRASHSGKIHVYDVIGYNRSKLPVCGFDPGPMTFPLDPDEVGPIPDITDSKADKFCIACLTRSTRTKKKCRDIPTSA